MISDFDFDSNWDTSILLEKRNELLQNEKDLLKCFNELRKKTDEEIREIYGMLFIIEQELLRRGIITFEKRNKPNLQGL